jgi:hypothetical protein
MPAKKHVRGATDKEQRQYEHIKESAQRSGRYGGRAKEVAARTVMKNKKKKKATTTRKKESGARGTGRKGKRGGARKGARKRS